jgi:hypothetical protein
VINRRVVLRSRPVDVPAPTDFGVRARSSTASRAGRTTRLVVLENLSQGIDEAPAAFCRLLAGRTVGKTLVAVDGEA